MVFRACKNPKNQDQRNLPFQMLPCLISISWNIFVSLHCFIAQLVLAKKRKGIYNKVHEYSFDMVNESTNKLTKVNTLLITVGFLYIAMDDFRLGTRIGVAPLRQAFLGCWRQKLFTMEPKLRSQLRKRD